MSDYIGAPSPRLLAAGAAHIAAQDRTITQQRGTTERLEWVFIAEACRRECERLRRIEQRGGQQQ